jgi:hypothetical protein
MHLFQYNLKRFLPKMMEICSDAVDSQTAKLDEFVLVIHKIRKAGRGARPGLSKFKLSPRKGGHT